MSGVKNNVLMNGLASRWAALVPRERMLVGSAIALVAVALIWWVGISPALKQLRQAQEAAPQLDAQLQQMRAQASEAAALKVQRALSYDESLRSLENSVKTLGPGATLSVSDTRASITLRAVSGDALAAWLAQVRANARLVPSELRLRKSAGAASTPVSSPAASAWEGSIVLNLPSK